MKKQSKKFAIVTSSDEKYGDFLVNHWLNSLINNIDLDYVDIIILDYGLNSKQKEIAKKNAILVSCKKNGNVTVIRFYDMLNYFKNKKYEQILSCDGGDIIFQKNIMNLFYENTNDFRAVTEDLKSMISEFALNSKALKKDVKKTIKKFLSNKRTINAGFFIAPYKKFIMLCKYIDKNIIDKSIFGIDQLLLNTYFYKNGFVELNKKYNFIPAVSKDRFYIKNGEFYDKNWKLIPVIHNAGAKKIFRTIKNFGYGSSYNKLNKSTYVSLNMLYRSIAGFLFFKGFLKKYSKKSKLNNILIS